MIPTNRTAAQSLYRIPIQAGSLAFTNVTALYAPRTSLVRAAPNRATSGITRNALRSAGSVRQEVPSAHRGLATAVHSE